MTTIVYKDGVMAGDRMSSVNIRVNGYVTKVHKIRNHLVGLCGNLGTAFILLDWFRNGCIKEEFPGCGDGEDFARLIVVTPERDIFIYESNKPIPIRFEGSWFVSGSGADFAAGALMMSATPAKAIEIASILDCHTGGGVNVISLDAAP